MSVPTRWQDFKQQVLNYTDEELEVLLPSSVLKKLQEDAEASLPYPTRQRIWGGSQTLMMFIRQVLQGGSCSDAVSYYQAEQISRGESACSQNTSAYCQARKRLPEALTQELMRDLGHRLAAESRRHWSWRGRDVKLVDGSTLSMSDTPANQAMYPQESNQKEGLGFPLMRILVLVSLNCGALLDARTAPYSGKGTGESALFRQLDMSVFKPGDICLLDRYYDNFWVMASLMMSEIELLLPLGNSRKIEWLRGQIQHGDSDDRLFTLNKPERPKWMTVEDYQAIPKQMTVRIFQSKGRRYLTTMLDARKYRIKALTRLYQQRWQVEVDLRFIKRTMNLEPLRCKTPEMVRKELAVTLVAYNLIRLVMFQAAVRCSLWPRHLSFKGAWTTLLAFAPLLRQSTAQTGPALLDEMLRIIASKTIGNRRRRVEPRAVKRRKRKYPCLSKPRGQAKQELLDSQKSRQLDSQQREIHAILT